ncbi:MAG: 5-methylcytosine restriction system specificity protein McrC [Nitrososphaeraceae archaeon]
METILALCELLLKNSSIGKKISEKKTALSFLININKLFEKFVVVNILMEHYHKLTKNMKFMIKRKNTQISKKN